MPNLYLSFLGTNDYLPCTYEYLSERIANVRFVQEATIRMNCMDWQKQDRVVIFTTQKAFRQNWKDDGHRDPETGEKNLVQGLETSIRNIDGHFSLEQQFIPDGSNEKEIWEIFTQVFESIRDEDEIIFDITHAFRSIPMLAIVVLNYSKIMKKASLKGIYYGAMESLGSLSEARKLTLEKRIVPVMDLSAFDQLMEWSVAADRFLGAGDASQISRISDHTVGDKLSHAKGSDRLPLYTISKLARSLEKFTKTLSTCRGRDISPVAKRLKQNLSDCKRLSFNKPHTAALKTILGKIEDQINLFPGHFIRDGIQAARWTLEHNLVQQSYTILQETLITCFVYGIGEDPENYRNKNRSLATQAIAIFNGNLPYEKWKKEAAENRVVVEKFINFCKTQPELIKTYINLTGYRNDFNHAGYNEHSRSADKFSRDMPEFLDKIEAVVKTLFIK